VLEGKLDRRLIYANSLALSLFISTFASPSAAQTSEELAVQLNRALASGASTEEIDELRDMLAASLASEVDAGTQNDAPQVSSSALCSQQASANEWSQAAITCLRAAEDGDAISQHNYGWMLHNGSGVQRDYAQAVHWYSAAAQQGYAPAQYNLGYMFMSGYEDAAANLYYLFQNGWLDPSVPEYLQFVAEREDVEQQTAEGETGGAQGTEIEVMDAWRDYYDGTSIENCDVPDRLRAQNSNYQISNYLGRIHEEQRIIFRSIISGPISRCNVSSLGTVNFGYRSTQHWHISFFPRSGYHIAVQFDFKPNTGFIGPVGEWICYNETNGNAVRSSESWCGLDILDL